MNKLQSQTVLKTLCASIAGLLCLPAHAGAPLFPSDGSANSFNSTLPQKERNSAKQTENLAISYVNYMKETLKLTPVQAAGLVGSLMYESGGERGLNGGWLQRPEGSAIGLATMEGNVSNHSGAGIAQWQDSRKQGLINFAKFGKLACTNNNEMALVKPGQPNLPTSSQAVNFGYLLYELNCAPAYKPVLPALKAQTTLLGAVCQVEKLYQQPLLEPGSAQRLKYANMVARWLMLPAAGGTEPTGDVCGPKPANASGGNGHGNIHLANPGPLANGPDGVYINNANGYGPVKQYERFIVAASQATGVPVDLIAAVIFDESSGNANVGCTLQPGTTNTWNCGLMQLRSDPGSRIATDPATNIMHGTQWIANEYRAVIQAYGSPAEIMRKYRVSAWDLALRKYNSGSVDPNNIHNGFIATHDYVMNIRRFARQLQTTGHMSW